MSLAPILFQVIYKDLKVTQSPYFQGVYCLAEMPTRKAGMQEFKKGAKYQ